MSSAMAVVLDPKVEMELNELRAEFRDVAETSSIVRDLTATGGQEFTGNKRIDGLLLGAGYRSAQQVVEAARSNPTGLMQVRNIGPKSLQFILDTLDPVQTEFGVEALIESEDGLRLQAPSGFQIILEGTKMDGSKIYQPPMVSIRKGYWNNTKKVTWDLRVVEA